MTEVGSVQQPPAGRLSGWFVSQQSVLAEDYPWLRRLASGTAFDYRLRLIQVAVTSAVGVAIAMRCRTARVAWILPITVTSVRLLLDPLALSYYWGGLIALAVLALSTTRRGLAELVVLSFTMCLAMMVVVTIAEGRVGAGLLTLCALAVLARPVAAHLVDRSS